MIPARYEYITIIFFLSMLLVVLFEHSIRILFTSVQYWLGLGLFCVFCAAIETIALHRQWWEFARHKVIGFSIVGIPIEEYMLFTGFYTIVIAGWMERSNELD